MCLKYANELDANPARERRIETEREIGRETERGRKAEMKGDQVCVCVGG